MNGKLILPIRGKKHFTVFGGPFSERPDSMVGVKVAREIQQVCDIDVPIIDFQVPTDMTAFEYGLRLTVDAILQGKPVYVGCMGGRGRIGRAHV